MSDYNAYDAARFIEQNPLSVADMELDDTSILRDFAEHHAGGLYVLWRPLEDGWSVKMHDSWGGDDVIVVHLYDADSPDEDVTLDFTSGRKALRFFLAAISPGRLAYLREESDLERLSWGEVIDIQGAFEALDPATLRDLPENATLADMLDELEAAMTESKED